MSEALAVALGAAAGALLRWQAGLWLNARHAQLPLGTLLVNVVGGLLIGMALVGLARPEQQLWRLLLVTGFLGGLTTFSAFSGESLVLLQRGEWSWALAHSLLHLLGALGAAALGAWIAQRLS
ncbi:MAG TPA: fluoride efflux transporter CrcB [Piscinibacter sp.]|nr:fluoride efflux transporter CrcB [Piscinibacter sp.]